MLRCCRRTARGCRHAVRRGDFSLLSCPHTKISRMSNFVWISMLASALSHAPFPLVGYWRLFPRSRRVCACTSVAPVKAGGKAAREAGREIGTDYFDVALPKNVADGTRGLIFHTLSLYVPCNALSPAYLRFEVSGGQSARARRVCKDAATGRRRSRW
jgi:hypothetical protein